MTRREQLQNLRIEWEKHDEDGKTALVELTTLMFVVGEVDADVALTIFMWARAEGIGAPETDDVELTDEELDVLVA